MRFNIKGFTLDTSCVFFSAIPIVVALFFTFLIVINSDANLKNDLTEKGQFIIMPRNCYLKTP